MKVLLEMRPALDGHAGIPQETRLLFRTLATLPEVEVEGLIQSANKVLPHAMRGAADGVSKDRAIDAQSRVVIALQQHEQLNRLEWLGQILQRLTAPSAMVLRSLLRLRTPLSRFDPAHFEDFVWRAFFAKSLPLADRERVTACWHRVARVPWGAMHLGGLLSRRFGHAVYPRLDTRDFDAFIAETPYPGRVSGRTQLVIRYHDAIPLLMPHTISKKRYHQASHFHALKRNVADGAWFACVSDATRRDLLSVFPQAEPRSVVIPNMVSHQFFGEESPAARVPEIVWARRNRQVAHGGGVAVSAADLRDGQMDYLLVVSTLEPRKNHLAVLEAWERLRTGPMKRLNLVCVGSLGWDHAAIVSRMSPWLERGGLHLLENVPADDLRLLYRHARATVCPSFSEGFDFAGVEAMCSGGAVVSSDIAVHREIYGDASLYFSPYSSAELEQQLLHLLADDETAARLRARLVSLGREQARAFDADHIRPQWAEFLGRVATGSRD